MLAEIQAGVQSLKMASDIIKGLNAANTQATINEIKLGLQAHIFEAREALAAAQETQTSTLQRIRELEKQIVQFEDWKREKNRYYLEELPPGSFVYALKKEMASGEPFHRLCATCYGDGKKRFLNSSGRHGDTETEILSCHDCGSTIEVDWTKWGRKVEERSDWAVPP